MVQQTHSTRCCGVYTTFDKLLLWSPRWSIVPSIWWPAHLLSHEQRALKCSQLRFLSVLFINWMGSATVQYCGSIFRQHIYNKGWSKSISHFPALKHVWRAAASQRCKLPISIDAVHESWIGCTMAQYCGIARRPHLYNTVYSSFIFHLYMWSFFYICDQMAFIRIVLHVG